MWGAPRGHFVAHMKASAAEGIEISQTQVGKKNSICGFTWTIFFRARIRGQIHTSWSHLGVAGACTAGRAQSRCRDLLAEGGRMILSTSATDCSLHGKAMAVHRRHLYYFSLNAVKLCRRGVGADPLDHIRFRDVTWRKMQDRFFGQPSKSWIVVKYGQIKANADEKPSEEGVTCSDASGSSKASPPNLELQRDSPHPVPLAHPKLRSLD